MIHIKELRTEKQISQKDLAKHFHVAQSTISSWEKGARDPDTATVAALAAFFGVSTDYLLEKTDIRSDTRTTLDDDDIKFALFGTTDIDDATLEDIKAYARFKREQYSKR